MSKEFPESENFTIRQQLWRALDLIILNIAKGSQHHSDQDFSHFLNIALSSTHEAIACFDIALDDTYITQKEFDTIIKAGEELSNQPTAFSTYVRPEKHFTK